jgi:hypothetical protein
MARILKWIQRTGRIEDEQGRNQGRYQGKKPERLVLGMIGMKCKVYY